MKPSRANRLRLVVVFAGVIVAVGCYGGSWNPKKCSETDDTCPAGSACECDSSLFSADCRCVEGGCNSNDDCGMNHVCRRELFGGRTCVQGCEMNDDCPAHTFCPCGWCGAFDLGGDYPDAGDPYPDCVPGCHDSTECAVGLTCVVGRCVLPCGEQSECPSGTSCVLGECVPPCNEDSECPPGTSCKFAECVSPCHGDSECPWGRACVTQGDWRLATSYGCEYIRECSARDDCYCTDPTLDFSVVSVCDFAQSTSNDGGYADAGASGQRSYSDGGSAREGGYTDAAGIHEPAPADAGPHVIRDASFAD